MSNFRSSHAYPLFAVTVYVRRHALAVNLDAVVARRMKRLPTIIDKLERHPNMNVTTMHDLGGCRVVFPDVTNIDELAERLRNAPRTMNAILREYDYLREPQNTGYRGVHLVYEYRASKGAYVGSKVEVQIRSDLQHAWATAVETMDLFGRTRLKYGEGDPLLRRYFLLVSSLMAVQEGLPQPTAAQGDAADLRHELSQLESQLGIAQRLAGYEAFVRRFGSVRDRRSTFILELNRDTAVLTVTRLENLRDAEARLAAIEAQGDETIDAVLVSAQKVSQLQSAYPNYFANTTAFRQFLSDQMFEGEIITADALS
ncbi:RelA/SpoT domain-containing protein [Microbacterium sp. BG28]|uniref:RelA/SpoT domain-containing protein n=1 Tax=Microbacterium sp. BG28 TaxID=3097356 RepID=UPI002A598662|nr:RelA/SpoT domain-containing protein [Microbacterium sp. BG28]